MEPFLVVGHTTAHSTIVWLCGESVHRSAEVVLRHADSQRDIQSQALPLVRSRDYTATAPFGGLEPDTAYEVHAYFRRVPVGWGGWHRPRTCDVRVATVRTYPATNCDEPFRFLLGSCNLSVVSLTHLGGLVAGALGTLAARDSLDRPPAARLPGVWRAIWRPLRKTLVWLVPRGFGVLYWATRFEQPKPLLPSPFAPLIKEDPPAFAVHAGDQIYFDFPFPRRAPDDAEYRRTYRQTWSEEAELRTFLGRCPQYMALDDHEIVDNFAADFIPDSVASGGKAVGGKPSAPRKPGDYLAPAERVYREYVAARHPARGLFYEFEYGVTRFFVLDTRTKRFRRRGEMIDETQMAKFKRWLSRDPERLKFVVSSVPFVAEMRCEELEQERHPSEVNGKPPYQPDKWSDAPYRRQRDEIIEFLYVNGISRVVFLVGDMHCAYHATLRVGAPERRLTIHELASGPIHQLQFGRAREFHTHFQGTTCLGQKLPFSSSIRRIHASAGLVLWIDARPRINELIWEVRPTRIPSDDRGEAGPPERRSIRL